MMKRFSLKSLLVATAAATMTLTAGVASAQESQSNNIMMGFNPFESTFSTVSAPSYMIGFKANDNLLPFAYVSIIDNKAEYGDDTVLALGGGARMYLSDISNRIRPYAGGAFGIVNAADTGFGLGGFFGAEAMITDGFSVSGQVGLEISDSGCTGCDTNFELGTANVMFNLYF
ncbi:MAG TPA: hypothetical protein VL091_00290 [Marinobacter sp.]|nr:hypothetical protein [Marinobacter sp.]